MTMISNIQKGNKILLLSVVKILHSSGAVITLYANLILKSSGTKSTLILGGYVSGLSILFAVMTIIGGRLADKYPIKRLLPVTQIASALIILLYFALDEKMLMIIFFALIYGIYNLSTPIITLGALHQWKGVSTNGVFSILLIALNIGVAFWSLAISWLNNIEYLLWIIFAINLLTAVVGLFLEKNSLQSHETIEEDSSNTSMEAVKWLVKDGKILIAFMVLMIAFSINLSQLNVTVPIFADQIFGKLGDNYYSYIVFENAVILIVCTWMLHKISYKLSISHKLMCSAALYVVSFGVLMAFQSLVGILVAIFLFSCGEIMSNTTGNSFVLEKTPKKYIATYNSVYNVVSGSGTVIGPLLSTFLILKVGINGAWCMSILISLLSIIVLYFVFYRKERKK